jgi:hypothetical protein
LTFEMHPGSARQVTYGRSHSVFVKQLLPWKPVVASVRLVHPRTWFKPTVANCFATDRSKAVTPQVFSFVNCLWCLFWNWSFYYPCSLSLYFLAVWGGCVFWMWPFLICIFHFLMTSLVWPQSLSLYNCLDA